MFHRLHLNKFLLALFEDPNALIFSRIGDNGTVYKSCLWLLTRSQSQLEANCDVEVYARDYGPVREECPFTCGTCDCFEESEVYFSVALEPIVPFTKHDQRHNLN